MKKCTRCKQIKDLAEFAISGKGRATRCKVCIRELAKAGRQSGTIQEHCAAKYARIALIKKSPCADCGQTFPPCCMDFDHVRGEKRFSISRCVTRSWDAIQSEINKCDLVCANCHRIRTFKRKDNLKPKSIRLPESRVGQKRSEEARLKMSVAQKRVWENPEHRLRMSQAHIGQVAWNKGLQLS
jgi:hypothetical protein